MLRWDRDLKGNEAVSAKKDLGSTLGLLKHNI